MGGDHLGQRTVVLVQLDLQSNLAVYDKSRRSVSELSRVGTGAYLDLL